MLYDVIVVGAGASGSALAVRLAESGQCRVLLLEAGPADPGAFPDLNNPATLFGANPSHPANWAFPATLTPSVDHIMARGRMLGGSTAINAGYFVRARTSDFDRWSSDPAASEWSYASSLPFYRQMEHELDFVDAHLHGYAGPVRVGRTVQSDPTSRAFVAAVGGLGFADEPDKNAQGRPGVGPIPMNVTRGHRSNVALDYLQAGLAGENLHVIGNSEVLRVLFDNDRVVGVEVADDDGRRSIAAPEVVLCAGAIKSAQLLMVSGIGPGEHLEKLGIPVRSALDGVGASVDDHPQVAVDWLPRAGTIDTAPSTVTAVALNLASDEEGMASGNIELMPLLRPIPELLGSPHTGREPASILVTLHSARSRGRITLRSADVRQPPNIQLNYLAHEADIHALRTGVRVTTSILESDAFFEIHEHSSSPLRAALRDDESLDLWIRQHLSTAYHLCGSAPFGAEDDPRSVVSQYGRVWGVTGLRVADLSILPSAPSRGPAATAVLIGERVAAFMERGD